MRYKRLFLRILSVLLTTLSLSTIFYRDNGIVVADAFMLRPEQASLLSTFLHNTPFKFKDNMPKSRRSHRPLLFGSKVDINDNNSVGGNPPRLFSTKQLSQTDFSQVERIFAISDLHTDNIHNLSWLKERCNTGSSKSDDSTNTNDQNINNTPGSKDILIVAGDISHEFSTLKETLKVLTSHLQCTVFFIPGNHEAWIGGKAMDEIGVEDSIQKLEMVTKLCQDMDFVEVEQQLVGGMYSSPVWICPIQGWYDGSLTLPNCQDLSKGFYNFPWTDFARCDWPKDQYPPYGKNHEHGKIPQGLVEYFLSINEPKIGLIRSSFLNSSSQSEMTPKGLITFSHFLPTQKVLPDWKNVHSNRFVKEEWLDHGAGGISAKFAKVAGSSLLDDQIRSILPNNQNESLSQSQHHRHLHVFGHSHRPKDVTISNIRYIHNPLGKPSERELRMISPNVDFQLIWDCRSKEGEVEGEEIIRYWEEKGGGKEALRKNMERRRRKRRETMRVIMERE